MRKFVWILFVWVSQLSAQPFNLLNYNVGEGLSQSQAWCILQDRKGYLWCGTQGGGLNRFDGARFEQYGSEEGLPSTFIQTLYEDSHGVLWAGTNRGIARFDGLQFHTVGNQKLQVNAIAEDGEGRLLAGTPSGLYTIDETGNWHLIPAYPPIAIYTLHKSGNYLWVGTSAGIYCNGKRQGAASRAFTAIVEGAEGTIWAGTQDGLLNQFPVSGGQPDLQLGQLGKITCLFYDQDQTIWVGTQHEGITILRASDSVRTHLNENNGLPHPFVRQIMADQSGHIWIATSGGGLVRRLDQPFRHFSLAQGLSGSRIYAFAEAPDQSIWWSASQNGLQWMDGTGIHRFTPDSGLLAGVKCKALCFDEMGRLWVGTEGKGLVVVDTSGSIRSLTTRQGLPSNWIQKIVADAVGNIWLGTYGEGLCRLDPRTNEVKNYAWMDGLPDLRIQTMALDREGSLWVGFQSGHIAQLVQGKVAKVEGLPGIPIRALAFDKSNRVWIGTKEGGLYWGDAGKYEKVPLPAPLSSLNIYSLVFDLAGKLWVGCENGVNQLTIDSDGQVVQMAYFSKSEGFLGIENCHDAALCDKRGNLWFGTMNGLTQRLPYESRLMERPPVLHYDQISIFYKPLNENNFPVQFDPVNGLSGILELPYHQNHLSFSFSAIDLDHPERIRYRWRLVGAEHAWSPWSEQHQINYANLAPGAYSFRVQATTHTGQIAEAPAIQLYIEQPFWQRWSFRLAVALVLALVVGAILRTYISRIRQREQQRRAQLEMKHNLLQLEQKALQLQMNPHFIFNALTAIQGVVAQQDTATARKEISHFARLMRSILSNSRRQEITLREEADTLAQYLQVEQFCREHKFDFSIHIDPELDPDDIKIPPMLLQPFVENAVVHGVANLTRPGIIEVYFGVEPPYFFCRITDNGIGRAAAAQRRQERKPGHQPAALQITRERLESLVKNKSAPPLVIEDITDVEGAVCGTRVIVRFEL